MAVADVIKDIRAQCPQAGKDHGIYLPPDPAKKTSGQWLARNRAIRFYQIKTDQRVEFKKMHRPLKIRAVDGSERKILVDVTKDVREIADQAGKILGLGKYAFQFCLYKDAPNPLQAEYLREGMGLDEQGCNAETDTFWFLKKYTVLDDELTVDELLPLTVFYACAKTEVLGGETITNRNDIKDLAALQLQISYGNCDPVKHPIGFCDVAEYLPVVHRKDKKLVQLIYLDYKKMSGMKDAMAKLRYLQAVRSLKTKGYSFFDVINQVPDERRKGKYKMIPYKFGISLNGFCLYDEKENKFVTQWTMMQLQRWDALNNVFNLHFAAEPLVLHTPQAAELADLIGGYIQIILRMRKDKEAVVSNSSGSIGEVEEEEAQLQQGSLTLMSSYKNPFQLGAGQGTWMDSGWGDPKKANDKRKGKGAPIDDLPSALKAARILAADLSTGRGNWGKGALTEDQWNKQLNAYKGDLNRDMTDMLGLLRSGGAGLQRQNLDLKAKNLHLSTLNVITAARNLATLNEDNAPLLDGAKAVCDSMADMLALIMAAHGETIDWIDVLKNAEKQWAAAQYLLNNATVEGYIDSGSKLLLVEVASVIDNDIEAMLEVIRNSPHGEALLKDINKVSAIKGVALSTISSLIPHLNDPQALKYLNIAKETLADITTNLTARVKEVGGPQACPELVALNAQLQNALNNLTEAAKAVERKGIEGNLDIVTPAVKFLNVLGVIRAHIKANDSDNLLASTLDQADYAQEELSMVAKMLAKQAPLELAQRLEVIAPSLSSDLVALMMEIKLAQSASTKNLAENEKALTLIATLERKTQDIISDAGRLTAVNNLRFHSKQVAGYLTRLSTTTALASSHINSKERGDLLASAHALTSSLAEMLKLLQVASNDPNNILAQNALMEGAKNQFSVSNRLIKQTKAVSANLESDPDLQTKLDTCVVYAHNSMIGLQSSMKRLDEMQGNVIISDALDELTMIRAELETAAHLVKAGKLTRDPNATVENCLSKLQASVSAMDADVDHVHLVCKKGEINQWPDAVLASAKTMSQVRDRVIPLISLIGNHAVQQEILAQTEKLLADQFQLVAAARLLVNEPTNPGKQLFFQALQKQIHEDGQTLIIACHGYHPGQLSQNKKDLEAMKKQLNSKPPKTSLQPDEILAQFFQSMKGAPITIQQLEEVLATNPQNLGYQSNVTTNTAIAALQLAQLVAANDSKNSSSILAAATAFADAMANLLKNAELASKPSADKKAFDKANAEALLACGNLDNTVRNAVGDHSHVFAHVVDTLNDLQAGKTPLLPLDRESILADMNQTTKALSACVEPLKGKSPKPLDAEAAKKIGLLAEQLILASYCAQNQPNHPRVMSLEAAKICSGCDLLSGDGKKNQKPIVQQIDQDAQKLLSTVKPKIMAQPDSVRRAEHLKHLQALNNALKDLNNVSASGKSCDYQAILLKSRVMELEKSLQGDAKDHLFEPAVATILVAKTKAVILPLGTLMEPASADEKRKAVAKVASDLDDLVKFCKHEEAFSREFTAAQDALKKACIDIEALTISTSHGQAEASETAQLLANKQKVTAMARDAAVAMQGMLKTGYGPEGLPSINAIHHFAFEFPEALAQVAIHLSSEDKDKLLSSATNFVNNLNEFFKPKDNAEMRASAKVTSEALLALINQLSTNDNFQKNIDASTKQISASLQSAQKTATPIASDVLHSKTAAVSNQLARNVVNLLNTTEAQATPVKTQQLEKIVTDIQTQVPVLVALSASAAGTPQDRILQANVKDSVNSIVDMIQLMKGVVIGTHQMPELLGGFNHSMQGMAKLGQEKTQGDTINKELQTEIAKINEAVAGIGSDLVSCWGGDLYQPSNKTVTAFLPEINTAYKNLCALASAMTNVSSNDDLLLAAKNVTNAVSGFLGLCSTTAKASSEWFAQEGLLSVAQKIGFDAAKLLVTSQHCLKDPTAKNQMKKIQEQMAGYGPYLVAPIQYQIQSDQQAKNELSEILQQIHKVVNAKHPPAKKASGEAFQEATKDVIHVAFEFMEAKNTDQKKKAGAHAQEALKDYLRVSEGLAAASKDATVAQNFKQSSKETVDLLVKIAEGNLSNQPNQNDKYFGQLQQSVQTTMELLEIIAPKKKVEKKVVLQELDTSSPENIESYAEKELLKCAQMIKEAASLLMKAPQKKTNTKMGLNIEQSDIREAILEAARAIATAVGNLIDAATVSQSERKADSLAGRTTYFADPAWANGLISAAHAVAGKVQLLVQNANAAAGGTGDEESLIASANAVNQVTIHLLHASRTKADPNAQSQRNLSKAAQAVSVATSQLVGSAQASSAMTEEAEEEDFSKMPSSAYSIRAQMEQKGKIERLEKELRDTRQELLMLRRAKYQK